MSTIDLAPASSDSVSRRSFLSRAFTEAPVTWSLLAAMAAMFAAEIVFGIRPWTGFLSPTIFTLGAFGGIDHIYVFDEQGWYRLFTAPFLHADGLHLLFNAIALLFASSVLEAMVGGVWLLVLFFIGGISGGLMSVTLNAPNTLSVGASGAIMALTAAIFALSFHDKFAGEAGTLRAQTLRILIPSLLPAMTATGAQVDLAAHFGGAIGGLVSGAFLLLIWRQGDTAPRLQRAATVLAALGVIATLGASVAVGRRYPAQALRNFLIPPQSIPEDKDISTKAADLLAHYPRDPRAHLYSGIARVRANDLTGAEAEIRIALDRETEMGHLLNDGYRGHIEAWLALVLYDQRKFDDARLMAHAGCTNASESFHDRLVRIKLCGNS